MSVLWIWMTSWLKDNWIKLLKVAAIVVAVVLIGGLIYETVAGRASRRRANTLISNILADNKRISDGLVDAEDRVVVLEGTVTDLGRGSVKLGEELAASEEISEELHAENRQLRRQLVASREITDSLRTENIRLEETLSASESDAGSISETSGELRASIDRAWSIVDGYQIPTGPE